MSPILQDITLGPVRLILGDCLKIAPTLEGVDAVVTDPPYGMNWDTDTTRFSGGVQKVSRGKDWGNRIVADAEPFDPEPWLKYDRVVLWGSHHFHPRLPCGTSLVWVKRNDAAFQSFLSDGELAWMKGGCGLYCFRDVPNIHDRGMHPTQKPVPLMSWCMDMAKIGRDETILDPYAGSGTTLIASIRTGRKAIGIEIDPKHYATAVERVRRELAQFTLPLETHQPLNQADLIKA